MADLSIVGEIYTIDNPDAKDRSDEPHKHRLAMLIEFESADEVREAMKNRSVDFSIFGD